MKSTRHSQGGRNRRKPPRRAKSQGAFGAGAAEPNPHAGRKDRGARGGRSQVKVGTERTERTQGARDLPGSGRDAFRPAKFRGGEPRPSQARPLRESAGLGHGRPDPDHAAQAPRWIYGRHAALAAILNPQRKVRRILAADAALHWIAEANPPADRIRLIQERSMRDIDQFLHEGAVHQGLAVEAESLPRARLKEACRIDARRRPVVVLDQITDPHNIGAIFRSAAAFGAAAVIVQDRRTPPLAGALAKAAAGAVEIVPCVEVVNIARALEGLKALGYAVLGLAAEAPRAIAEAGAAAPVALVLGAEGDGLRRLVRETCDALVRIKIDPKMESLNVSTACAIALYELTRPERTAPEGDAR